MDNLGNVLLAGTAGAGRVHGGGSDFGLRQTDSGMLEEEGSEEEQSRDGMSEEDQEGNAPEGEGQPKGDAHLAMHLGRRQRPQIAPY